MMVAGRGRPATAGEGRPRAAFIPSERRFVPITPFSGTHGVYRRLMRSLAAAVVCSALLSSAARAQPVDLPILDSDQFAHGLSGPSMEQSTAASAAFYEEIHRALQRAWGDHDRLGKVTVALFDVLDTGILPLPLGDAWLHEEY